MNLSTSADYESRDLRRPSRQIEMQLSNEKKIEYSTLPSCELAGKSILTFVKELVTSLVSIKARQLRQMLF